MILRLALTCGSIYTVFKLGDLLSEMADNVKLKRSMIEAEWKYHYGEIRELEETVSVKYGRLDDEVRQSRVAMHTEQLHQLVALADKPARETLRARFTR